MDPTTVEEPQGFRDLSKTEQIRYVQTLWDRIVDGPGEIPVSNSHLVLAERRLADYRRDPSSAQDAYDIVDRLTKEVR